MNESVRPTDPAGAVPWSRPELIREHVIALRKVLLTNGYQPTAVLSGQKRPIELDWQLKVGMPPFDTRTASTGILCGGLRAFDVDVNDPEKAAIVGDILERRFGAAPIRTRPGSPRFCALFRTAEDERPRKSVIFLSCGEVEVLGDGQQTMVDGEHPDGGVYTWDGLSPLNTPFEDLRAITEEQVAAVEDELLVVLGAEPAKLHGGEREGGAGREPGDVSGETKLDDIVAALDALPADYPRDMRVKIGMAAYAGSGGAGNVFEAFRRWREGHGDKIPSGAIEAAWKSFGCARSVTVATLFGEVLSRIPDWRKPSAIAAAEARARAKPAQEKGGGGSGVGGGGDEDCDDEEPPSPPPEPKRDEFKAANPLSLRRALHRDERTQGLVRLNSFALRIMLEKPVPRPGLRPPADFKPRPWKDADAIALCEHFNGKGFLRCNKNFVHDVIALEAENRSYHPVRDYLDGLVWDGTKRLHRFLFDHCGTIAEGDTDTEKRDQTRYIEAITGCFFLSGVARVDQPGCQADYTLVIEGEQGPGKSKLLRVLARRDEWFSDSLSEDLKSKDAKLHLSGRWIVELGEIAQLRSSTVETIKGFLSRRIDQYRPPYGKVDIDVPRQCVFAGTTNNDLYLHDTTGNRRYWPVRINTINFDTIRTIVDQLWAEAVALYRAGEPWHLTLDLEAIAADEQLDRLAEEPWQEILAPLAESCPDEGLTVAKCFQILDVKPADRTKAYQIRIGQALRLFGLTRKRAPREKDEPRGWVYKRLKKNAEKNPVDPEPDPEPDEPLF